MKVTIVADDQRHLAHLEVLEQIVSLDFNDFEFILIDHTLT